MYSVTLTFALVAGAVVLAGLSAATVIAVLQLIQGGGAHLAQHMRPQDVPHSRPGEMRCHRTATGTHVGTIGLAEREPGAYAAAPTAPHTLAGRDKKGRRYRVKNLVENTGDITQADLNALLGQRPADLIGATV